jgi:hypothetical protein
MICLYPHQLERESGLSSKADLMVISMGASIPLRTLLRLKQEPDLNITNLSLANVFYKDQLLTLTNAVTLLLGSLMSDSVPKRIISLSS